jgi:hypothetical protein
MNAGAAAGGAPILSVVSGARLQKNSDLSRQIINCLFAFVVFSVWPIVLDAVNGTHSSDFPAYYTTAMQVRAGNAADVYDMERQQQQARRYFAEGEGRAFEPPYALPAFVPLSFLSPRLAKLVFNELLAACLAAGSVFLAAALAFTGRQSLLLIVAIVVSGPVFELFKVSKPAAIFFMAQCIIMYLLRRGKELPAGATTALCLLKPHQILPLYAFTAGSRRIKLLLAAALAALIVVAVTFPIVGMTAYKAYLQLLAFLNAHPEIPGVATMPTVKGQLLRLGADNYMAGLISNIVFTVALLALAFCGWRARDDESWWMTAFMLSFTLGIAACPYIHLYDHVIMIPGACILLMRLRAAKRRFALALCAVGLLAFVQPFYSWLHYYYLLAGNGTINMHFVAMVLISTAAVLSLSSPALE